MRSWGLGAAVDGLLSCRGFPGYLEEVFPEYLVAIWAVRSRNHPVVVTADMVVAEVFVDEILVARQRRDRTSISRTRPFDAADLGTAMLTAFRTATGDGR